MRALVVATLLLLAYVQLSSCYSGKEELIREANLIDVASITAHLDALYAIANTFGGGSRAATSPGYNASVEYVVDQLQSKTNFTVTVQPFAFSEFTITGSPSFAEVSPTATVYQENSEYAVLTYSGSGNVRAPVFDGATGCSAADFVNFPTGYIAVLQRGSCDFSTKADNAYSAGAAGVIVSNYPDQNNVLFGTLGSLKPIPVFGVKSALAATWFATTPVAVLTMDITTGIVTTYTSNVIADTAGNENANNVIVVGAHLDSVPAGPGINDNGSGSSTILEIATQLYRSGVNLKNRVRFAWWGAEELGLLGSTYYVNEAVKSGEITKIALNLNFDMVGSPNYFRGIYDGEGAAANIRTACVNIENTLSSFFEFENLSWNLTEFTGRSDYGPFIENGVPAGGLFTGAEVEKPCDWRKFYGGICRASFDTCYHQSCDDLENIDVAVLDQNARAAYYATLQLGNKLALREWLKTPHALEQPLKRKGMTPLPFKPCFIMQQHE